MCYGDSSTSNKKGMSSAFCRACFFEAAALDPHASSWLSQQGNCPREALISSGSEAVPPGCQVGWATPGGAGDSAQRIGHLPFRGTVGPRTHSLGRTHRPPALEGLSQACPGPREEPRPRNTKGEAPIPGRRGSELLKRWTRRQRGGKHSWGTRV